MKKALIILAAIAFASVSCNKGSLDIIPDDIPIPETSIVFNLTANHPDGAATKAVKTGWETGDVIYVFFSKVDAPKYLKMSFDGDVWNCAEMEGASAGSLGLSEGDAGTMRAVYLPFGNDITIDADGTAFTFSEITYSYYLTATLAYTVANSKVSGAFDMAIPDGYIQFFLDDADAATSTEIELREPHLTPQGIASIAADGTITHTAIAHGAPLKGYVYDKAIKETGESRGYLFSGILAAEVRNTSTDYHFTVVSGGWQGTYYAKAFTGKTWYRGVSEGRALKMPALSGWTIITDYKPIDLGLDVNGKRIYWSSRNLGASRDNPASSNLSDRQATYGDYYAWGETEPYYSAGAYNSSPTWKSDKTTGYSWTSYQFASSNNNSKFSKYTGSYDGSFATSGTADGLTTLELADDAANASLHGSWRMPTIDEWKALESDKKWTWNSTLKGCTITNKEGTAWTDPTVFLPTPGRRDGTSLTTKTMYDEIGFYWSSSLDTGWPNTPANAYSIYINQMYTPYANDYYERNYGLAIRPVCE